VSRRPPRTLPVLRPAEAEGVRSAESEGVRPAEAAGVRPAEAAGVRSGESDGVRGDADPARIAAGWSYRFTAEGSRAEEMVELYRELGFDVAADPVATGADNEVVCTECYDASPRPYRAIYTRQRGELPTE
jgi:hypothetical protein